MSKHTLQDRTSFLQTRFLKIYSIIGSVLPVRFAVFYLNDTMKA